MQYYDDMTQEQIDALAADCPNLFKQGSGMSIGKGWHRIVRDLCLKLEHIIALMPPKDRALYRVDQIKEKFGALRFYLSMETPEMATLIEEAEAESTVTCELCGAQGKMRGKGWVKTLCDQHAHAQNRL